MAYKTSKSKKLVNGYATEAFVYRVVNDSEKRLDKRIDKVEVNLGKKIDRVLTHLDGIAGQFKKFDEEQTMLSSRVAIHSKQIKKLQGAVFATA